MSAEALTRALVAVCDERGYEEATPGLLERRAGLEPGSFAAAFDSLEDCFLSIWDLAYDGVAGQILDAYGKHPDADWSVRLEAAVDEFLRLLRKRSNPVLRVLVLNTDRVGTRAAVRREAFIRGLAQLIDAGRFEAGALDEASAETAQTLAASIQHMIYSRCLTGRLSELRELRSPMLAFVMIFYRGHEVALAKLDRIDT